MSPEDDGRRRAFAILEIPPTASGPEIRRAYKRLVRRWHPDRFAHDPQGRAEADRRLRVINEAYEVVSGEAPPETPTRPAVRWSRDAVEEVARSIGNVSDLDAWFGFLAWAWPLIPAFMIAPPGRGAPWHRPLGAWTTPVQLSLVALAVGLYLWRRRRGKST